MNIQDFVQGFLIGISIAAPVGPIGLLCIRRTLTEGRLIGFTSGLGAAVADAIYGSIAAFGLRALSDILINQQRWFRLIGGLFLCYLGIRAFFSIPRSREPSADRIGWFKALTSTFVLTITNPLTILSFTAVFAGLGLADANKQGDFISAAFMVTGVFLGSSLWWFILSGGVSLFQTRFDTRGLKWVNRISGLGITLFGLIALCGALGR